MPKLTKKLPTYRKSGQAIVNLSGTDHYLGPHGTKASKSEYDRLTGAMRVAFCFAGLQVSRKGATSSTLNQFEHSLQTFSAARSCGDASTLLDHFENNFAVIAGKPFSSFGKSSFSKTLAA